MPKLSDEDIEAESKRLHVERMEALEEGTTASDGTAAAPAAAPAPKIE